ncbi:MAG: L-threonylcarbamoyladenylate synthase [Patescibacteria group bacterium]|jgi:L-threonylcarbamoyladenylate synthase
MQIISEDQLQNAIDVLAQGGVIVFPTETSYGLGCDATNAAAVERIFEIKSRDRGKALPVILPGLERASEFVVMSQKAIEFATRYWPGPLNIIAPIAPGSPIAPACGQDGFQSVRVSSHPIAARLARELDRPIVATSANISGQDALYDVALVEASFVHAADNPDLLVDGGVLPQVLASTTVKIVDDAHEILRQGEIHV